MGTENHITVLAITDLTDKAQEALFRQAFPVYQTSVPEDQQDGESSFRNNQFPPHPEKKHVWLVSKNEKGEVVGGSILTVFPKHGTAFIGFHFGSPETMAQLEEEASRVAVQAIRRETANPVATATIIRDVLIPNRMDPQYRAGFKDTTGVDAYAHLEFWDQKGYGALADVPYPLVVENDGAKLDTRSIMFVKDVTIDAEGKVAHLPRPDSYSSKRILDTALSYLYGSKGKNAEEIAQAFEKNDDASTAAEIRAVGAFQKANPSISPQLNFVHDLVKSERAQTLYQEKSTPPSLNNITLEPGKKYQTHVLIGGTGLAAIAAAQEILEKDPKAKVMMVDARHVASGQSGNSGGQAISNIQASQSELAENIGKEGADAIFKQNLTSIQRYEDNVRKFGLSVAFNRGHVFAARADQPDDVKWLNDLREEFKENGIAYEEFDAEKMKTEFPAGPNYHAGVYTKAYANLNPYLYVRGMAQALMDKYGDRFQVAEYAPITKFENDNNGNVAVTLQGGQQVTAQRFIDATGLGSHKFNRYVGNRTGVLNTGVVVVELKDAELPKNISYENSDEDVIWGKIFTGTNGKRYVTIGCGDTEGKVDINNLANALQEVFPSIYARVNETLRGMESGQSKDGITFATAQFVVTSNKMPLVKAHPNFENVYVINGFCGEGVSPSNSAGTAVAQAILGNPQLLTPWHQISGHATSLAINLHKNAQRMERAMSWATWANEIPEAEEDDRSLGKKVGQAAVRFTINSTSLYSRLRGHHQLPAWTHAPLLANENSAPVGQPPASTSQKWSLAQFRNAMRAACVAAVALSGLALWQAGTPGGQHGATAHKAPTNAHQLLKQRLSVRNAQLAAYRIAKRNLAAAKIVKAADEPVKIVATPGKTKQAIAAARKAETTHAPVRRIPVKYNSAHGSYTAIDGTNCWPHSGANPTAPGCS
jgi:gamma-glutamylputrescine oxidase